MFQQTNFCQESDWIIYVWFFLKLFFSVTELFIIDFPWSYFCQESDWTIYVWFLKAISVKKVTELFKFGFLKVIFVCELFMFGFLLYVLIIIIIRIIIIIIIRIIIIII